MTSRAPSPAIEFVNHASMVVDGGDGVRLLSDPWLGGTVFNHGWSLLSPSSFSDADFESITHLWISHEHPDHFHPPTLARIPKRHRAKLSVLYQAATDLAASHEIKTYFEKLGVREFVELDPDHPICLGPGVEILCRRHIWGDSWCHVRVSHGAGGPSWTIFNANDCEWDSRETALRAFSELGPVDVLAMQFSYACWYRDRDERRREADRLIDRMIMMTEVSGARYVLPFASFIRFCHAENVHLNDEVNTVERAARAVAERTSARAIVLYPGDVWTLGEPLDNRTALRKYELDHERCRQMAPVAASGSVNLVELCRKLSAFWETQRVAGRDDPAGPDLKVYLRDQRRSVRWTGTDLAALDLAERECDLSLASDSLAFLFDHRWGAGTLNINARFTLPEGSRFDSIMDIEAAMVRALGRRNWLIAGSLDTLAYGPVPDHVAKRAQGA